MIFFNTWFITCLYIRPTYIKYIKRFPEFLPEFNPGIFSEFNLIEDKLTVVCSYRVEYVLKRTNMNFAY